MHQLSIQFPRVSGVIYSICSYMYMYSYNASDCPCVCHGRDVDNEAQLRENAREGHDVIKEY